MKEKISSPSRPSRKFRTCLTLSALMLIAFTDSNQAQCLITDFEGANPLLNGRYLFRRPNFSGSTASFVDPTYPDSCRVSSDQAHSGTSSLRVEWKSTPSVANWLRLTTFRSGAVLAVTPNPQVRRSEAVSFWIYVPSTTPDLHVAVGVRETANYAGCGQDGGTVGAIEWVGASTRRVPGGPLGKVVSTKDQWVQLRFVLLCEPVLPFVGDGALNSPYDVLEHLAFTPVVAGEVGPFVVYLDDFEVESTLEFLAPVPQLAAPHLFAVGQTIPIAVRFRDCAGEPTLTGVTASIDVKGIGWDGVTVFHEVDEVALGVGDSLLRTLAPIDHHLQFNLGTFGFARGTALDGRFYSAEVVVTDDLFGFELSRGRVVLESQ